MDFPHKEVKIRFVHHIQRVDIVEDMSRSMPRIYPALENRQAKN